MNFLGHFYIDRDRNNPYFAFGALVPDLIRGFSKIYNHIPRPYTSPIEYHQSIYKGIIRHMQVDEAFHNLPLFHDACAEIENIFSKNKEIELPRVFFVAHILSELLIDKQVVLQQKNIAINYYSLLKQIDYKELINFSTSIHFLDFESNFLPKFEVFIQNEYALKLAYNENVYTALYRICFDRIQYNPTEIQKEGILKCIAEADEWMKEHYQLILNQTIENLVV